MTLPIPLDFQSCIQPILDDLGHPIWWSDFLDALATPLTKTITLHTGRISHAAFVQIATQEWWTVSLSRVGSRDTYEIDMGTDMKPLGHHRLHQCWYIYIQESAASVPVQVLLDYLQSQQLQKNNADTPLLVLDMAASPWGKTFQLAKGLWSSALIWANDSNNGRMRALWHNMYRMWLTNTVSTNIDGNRFGQLYPELFDIILLDAPCSGEGTMFKSAASLSMWKSHRIKSITSLQYQLMISAFKALKPWGVMVYSTCTLNPFENEEMLKRLIEYGWEDLIELIPLQYQQLWWWLSQYANTPLLDPSQAWWLIRSWPHIHHAGGFFVSLLRKKASLPAPNIHTHKKKSIPVSKPSITLLSASMTHTIQTLLESEFGVVLDTDRRVLASKHDTIHLVSRLRVDVSTTGWRETVGIPILRPARSQKSAYRPLQWLATTLWDQMQLRRIDLDQIQMNAILAHQEIERSHQSHTDNAYYVLIYQWYPLCMAKHKGSVLKGLL